MTIFEKILYGIKVANDNIVALNAKVDAISDSLTFEDTEPDEAVGTDECRIDSLNNPLC